jgi:hypothetical protein
MAALHQSIEMRRNTVGEGLKNGTIERNFSVHH